ncbi:MAG TPA: hypothetical protein VKQ32_22785 [Polyangia bacterium]|nr:hypothetical protein [Polyangia bacterium]
MLELERGAFRAVDTADVPWRPSRMAAGVFVKDLVATGRQHG